MLCNFHGIFEIGSYIYTESMTLCVIGFFIYKNSDTSKKAIQFVSVTQFFKGFMKLAEGEEAFL